MNNFINSIRKNYKGIIIIIVASLLSSLGQMIWKMSEGTSIQLLILGFVLYGIGAVTMIIAFKFGSLSVIHPMMSFGYVFAIIFGSLILHENISFYQYIGISIIIFGVILVGGGDD